MRKRAIATGLATMALVATTGGCAAPDGGASEPIPSLYGPPPAQGMSSASTSGGETSSQSGEAFGKPEATRYDIEGHGA